MSEEFEKWLDDNFNELSVFIDKYNISIINGRWTLSKDCTEILKSLWDAKHCQQQAKIDAQAKELAKLQEFNKALFRFSETGISGRSLYNAYYDYGLIGDNGNLTHLLTGETSCKN